jgi:hypothetical protein
MLPEEKQNTQLHQAMEVVNHTTQQTLSPLHRISSRAEAVTPLAFQDTHQRLGLPTLTILLLGLWMSYSAFISGHSKTLLHLTSVRRLSRTTAPIVCRNQAVTAQLLAAKAMIGFTVKASIR